MAEVEIIRMRRADGWSIRKIARQLEISRQTVRKALEGPAEPPRYRLQVPRPQPVTGPYVAVIAKWLTEDETAPKKQRHTARRVYDRLVLEYGFSGSERSVRRVVRELRGRIGELYVPLEAVPGKVAQVDFGQAQVLLAGESVRVFLFCVRAKFSRVPFAVAFRTEKLEAFLQGHVEALAFFGGVFKELWFDNPKTAVTKILAGPEREEHEAFSQLRAHYLFRSAFCNPGQPHEKGSVENLVGYVRRNALVPHSRPFASLEELNRHLLAWSERERERNLADWLLEEGALLSLPARPFRAATSRPVRASKLALVRLDYNRYSVPVRWAGLTLRAEVYAGQLEFYAGQALVARHGRSYRRGETFLTLEHYLPAFKKKPRAAAGCAALWQADPVFLQARDLLLRERHGYRVFAEILLLGLKFPLETVAEALGAALSEGAVSAESVRQRCLNLTHVRPPAAAVPDNLVMGLAAPDLSRYDQLLEVGR
jgi:transposase